MTGRAHRSAAQDAPAVAWAKSQASNPSGECVELAAFPDSIVAIRNSRYPDELWLLFPRDQVQAFIQGAKAGEFDHLVEDRTDDS